jgi:hypothetical protein
MVRPRIGRSTPPRCSSARDCPPRCVKLTACCCAEEAVECAEELLGDKGQLPLAIALPSHPPPAGRAFILDHEHVCPPTVFSLSANLDLSPPLPPFLQEKMRLPWNAGSGDDAFSLAPLLSSRTRGACWRAIRGMLYPFARGSAAQEAFKHVMSYYNPFIAVYFQWLHALTMAMAWLIPALLLTELYLCVNDFMYPGQPVDDYDNRLTILLCITLMLWSVFVSSSLQRFVFVRLQRRRPHATWLPPPSLRAVAALGVTLAFLYIACKMNEARLVYLLYSLKDFERDNSGVNISGFSFSRVYQFALKVRVRACVAAARPLQCDCVTALAGVHSVLRSELFPHANNRVGNSHLRLAFNHRPL